MAHRFGALDLPIASAALPVGDPKLQKLVDFFAAALGAWATTAWAAVAPGQPIVRTKFTHSPVEAVFAESQLPALYCYAEQQRGERMADDFDTTVGPVVLLWVPEPATQDNAVGRLALYANAIYKVVRAAAKRERVPAWVDVGDTDPLAATEGSNIVIRARLAQRINATSGALASVDVPMADGRGSKTYDAVRIELDIREAFGFDDDDATVFPAAVTHDVTVEDETHGEQTLVEFDDPIIP